MAQQGQYDSPLSATLKGITDLFKKQERIGQLADDERLDGKKVLITGSSAGLGFAAAIQLASRGAFVIMACRSGIPEKGKAVQAASGSDQVAMVHVDLADIDSIQALVKTVKMDYGQIDILICNAAVVPRESRKTPQGLEEMFMVNYLAKYLLVRLLIQEDGLNYAGKTSPRIIFVSSESHRNPKAFQWDQFGKYQNYKMGKTVELYGYYKLLLTTLARELARRMNTGSKTEVSVFALCPGPVNSKIAREAPKIFLPLLKIIFGLFFRSPQKAAEPVIYLACSPAQEGKETDYLFLMSRKNMDEKALDPENGKKLWQLSENLLQQLGVNLLSI